MQKKMTVRPLSDMLALQKDPVAFFQNAQQYGDIVQLPAGLKQKFYVLNDPELIKDVMLTKSTFFKKGRAFEVLKKVVGEGLLTSNGDVHRRQRTLLQPHFCLGSWRGMRIASRRGWRRRSRPGRTAKNG